MKTIATNLRFGAAAVFALLVFAVLPNAASAQSEDALELLRQEVWRLQTMLEQRLTYPLSIVSEEEWPEYYHFETSAQPVKLYGDSATEIEMFLDGSVNQLLFVQDCDNSGFIAYGNSNTCDEYRWMMVQHDSEETGLTKVDLDVKYRSALRSDETSVEIYACRFDGCRKEVNLEFVYSEEKEFGYNISVWPRYDYYYEYDEEEYYVKELYVDFPTNEVRSLEVRAYCEDLGNGFKTYEDNRVACGERKRISPTVFNDGGVDEDGKGYSFILQYAAENSEEIELGGVDVRLKFTSDKNKVFEYQYTF